MSMLTVACGPYQIYIKFTIVHRARPIKKAHEATIWQMGPLGPLKPNPAKNKPKSCA